jgi:hypothetical protein
MTICEFVNNLQTPLKERNFRSLDKKMKTRVKFERQNKSEFGITRGPTKSFIQPINRCTSARPTANLILRLQDLQL